jgi:hypothetical protein
MTPPLQNQGVDANPDQNARQRRAEIEARGDRLHGSGQPSRQSFAGGTRGRPLRQDRLASHARKSDGQIILLNATAPPILFGV